MVAAPVPYTLAVTRIAVALIPARGGSKGVPRKNLEVVGGLSLLERAISGALLSNKFDKVIVSSDDSGILQSAAEAGAVCLVRSESSSGDRAQATEVVQHFLGSQLATDLEPSSVIVYLQPTSPFRNQVHISEALAQMEHAGATSLVSVRTVKDHPFLTLEQDSLGRLEGSKFWNPSSTNRQDYPQLKVPNGAIYAFVAREFSDRGRIPVEGALPFFMTQIESLDIDTPDDLLLARAIANYAGI